jgi:hypothetical protein
MPDTLDLTDRAALGINGLIGTTDPARDYEPYFLSFFASKPQYMTHWSSMVSGVFSPMMQGVEKQHSAAVTSSMLGCFRNEQETRTEFLSLIRNRTNGV